MEQKAVSAAVVYKDSERGNTTLIKICAMLLVVYCHSISIYMAGGWGPETPARTSAFLGSVASWLNTFHVYTFIAVSGYLFYYLRFETHRYDRVPCVLKNKALRLLLPYACASILWVIPFDICFWGFAPGRLFQDYALMLSPCQLWFLPMLFFVFFAFVLLCTRVRFDQLSQRQAILWLALLYIVSVAASALASFGVPNVFQITRALQCLLYFYAGMLWRRYDLSKLYRWKYVLLAFVLSIGLFLLSQRMEAAGGLFALLRMPLRPLVSLCGAAWLVLLCNKIAHPSGTENGLFRLLSRSMFPVYLFHQQWIYLVIVLLNHRGIAPYWLGEISFAVSLSASLLLTWLLGKWKVTRRMFSIG